ncbi:uncharacterized protein LOC141639570 [Silene latifolia]|uniref:uncharacterized protein LOC141639570 n=1 Tax=Silene latifolia TaxID=37657 RepID=UPI003D780670
MARKINRKKSQIKNTKTKTKAKLRLSFTNCTDLRLDMDPSSSSSSGIPTSADAHKTRDVNEIVGIPVLDLDNIVEEEDLTQADVDNLVEEEVPIPEDVEHATEWTEVTGKKSKSPSKASSTATPMLQFSREDVESELQFWDTAVVCYVLGGNPPWEYIRGFVRKIWVAYKIDKISFLPNGVFIVRFPTKECQSLVLQQGFPMFDNKPLVVKPWTEESGLIGKFLERDGATEDKTRLGYARLLIEVEIEQILPEKLYFKDEMGRELSILVEYEWKPSLCGLCKGIGHTSEMCKKKKVTAPVTKPAKPPQQQISRQEHGGSVNVSPTKSYVAALTSPSSDGSLKGRMEEPPGLVSNGYSGVLECGLGPHWEGINNNEFHHGGRVWVIWDPQVFRIVLLAKNAQVITVQVTEVNSGDLFILSVVYGSNDDGERLELWNHLKDMKRNYHGPWGVCGDFNNVLNYNERIGREVMQVTFFEFRACVDFCGLMDIKGQGSFFTWNNKQVPASRGFSRIDRFMVNDDWMVLYPDAYSHFLPEGLFDHNPCVCYRRISGEKRKSHFRYYNMWSLEPSFKTIVQASWSTSIAGTLMYRLVTKLRNLKNPLKMLNRNGFSDVEKSVGVAKALLEDIQCQMYANPTDLNLLSAEQEAAASYRLLCKIQHSFLSQKAKVDWLHFGDDNTRFFHSQIRARQVHNRVLSIQGADGVLHNSCVEIERAFLDYYMGLLGTSKPTSKTGKLLKQVNTTSITLIPKTDNPTSVLEFRPIAFCNTVYKVLAKVLCNRLSKILPDIVCESQGGFIQNRNIVENVLICQDLVRLYNRKAASPRCLIKIDLRKAYDSVEWNFLYQMLLALNFPQKFIDLLMACVTSPSYSLSVNGNKFGFFKGKKGLRQGDPLSPLLFTLCMEYLSRILGMVAQQPDFRFHPLCGHTRLNHLLFADDLLLFCKGNDLSIMWLLRAFATFSDASGLCLNRDKSNIYFNGVATATVDAIFQVSGFQRGALPFKYLGVPISSKRLTKNEGQKLLDRIVARIRGWGAKHLSYLCWDTCCLPKEEGGLGIKDAKTWNRALLGKYVWWLANKKDRLWVRWINHVYMKGKDWTDYKAPSDCNWSWKKITHIMSLFKQAYTNNKWLQSSKEYTVVAGYDWLRMHKPKVDWRFVCWNSLNLPKSSFIFWVFMHQRWATRDRLARMGLVVDPVCPICCLLPESHSHLVYECSYAKTCFCLLQRKLGCTVNPLHLVSWFSTSRMTKMQRRIIGACYIALIYWIWRIRNEARVDGSIWRPEVVILRIVADIKTRFLKHNVQPLRSRDRVWIQQYL